MMNEIHVRMSFRGKDSPKPPVRSEIHSMKLKDKLTKTALLCNTVAIYRPNSSATPSYQYHYVHS